GDGFRPHLRHPSPRLPHAGGRHRRPRARPSLLEGHAAHLKRRALRRAGAHPRLEGRDLPELLLGQGPLGHARPQPARPVELGGLSARTAHGFRGRVARASARSARANAAPASLVTCSPDIAALLWMPIAFWLNIAPELSSRSGETSSGTMRSAYCAAEML